MNLKPTKLNILGSLLITLSWVIYKTLWISRDLCPRVDCFNSGNFNSLFHCCKVSLSELVMSYFLNIVLVLIVLYFIVSMFIKK
jgi:hypothetical protein